METIKQLTKEWKELQEKLQSLENINVALIQKAERLQRDNEHHISELAYCAGVVKLHEEHIQEWKNAARAKGLDDKFQLLMRKK